MIYRYRCPACKGYFEEDYRIGRAPAMADCPNCHTRSRRVITAPHVHFKARGFTGAGRAGAGRVDHFRHKDGSVLTDTDKNRIPAHCDE